MRRVLLGFVLGVVVVLTVGGCAHGQGATAAGPPAVTADEVARALPARVVDRAGWADDIVAAIHATGKTPTRERVCAVVAVIAQESGFVADPPVRDLPRLVRRALDDKLAPLGALAPAAREALLALRPPGAPEAAPTFGERIARLKTERDLDRLFRDVKAALTRSHPGSVAIAGALAVLAGRGDLDSLNPVTTAGSMQVKVDFARTLSPALDDAAVREQLYTRAGGVRAGTARLLGYAASYEDVVYRFADYNAGVYASRNAALQMQIAALAGVPLTRDGDLLIYAPDGSVRDVDGETLRALMALAPRLGLSERRVRADARREKSVDLEDTDTWRAVRAAFSAQTGRPAPYAQVPAVDLRSPKLSRARTTSWFASSVKQHYARCRAAG